MRMMRLTNKIQINSKNMLIRVIISSVRFGSFCFLFRICSVGFGFWFSLVAKVSKWLLYLSRLTFRRQVVTFSTKHTLYSYVSCIICLNI